MKGADNKIALFKSGDGNVEHKSGENVLDGEGNEIIAKFSGSSGTGTHTGGLTSDANVQVGNQKTKGIDNLIKIDIGGGGQTEANIGDIELEGKRNAYKIKKTGDGPGQFKFKAGKVKIKGEGNEIEIEDHTDGASKTNLQVGETTV